MQFDAETDGGSQPKAFYRQRWFWLRFMPGLLTALLLMVGIVMVIRYKHVKVIYFEVGVTAVCLSSLSCLNSRQFAGHAAGFPLFVHSAGRAYQLGAGCCPMKSCS